MPVAGQSALWAHGSLPMVSLPGRVQLGRDRHREWQETEAVSPVIQAAADGSRSCRSWEAGVPRCRNHPDFPPNARLHLASSLSSWLKAGRPCGLSRGAFPGLSPCMGNQAASPAGPEWGGWSWAGGEARGLRGHRRMSSSAARAGGTHVHDDRRIRRGLNPQGSTNGIGLAVLTTTLPT